MPRTALPMLALATLSALAPARAQQPLTSAFTYQGRLLDGGAPVTGNADVQFDLWNDVSAGATVAPPIVFDGSTNPVVSVTDGNFTVALDWGEAVFDGNRRWLEISVRHPSGSGSWVVLAPRQELTVAPYSLQTRGLHVDANRNVGIGTVTPAWPLDIEDSQAVIRLTTRSNASGSVLELHNKSVAASLLGAINFNDLASSYPGQISYQPFPAQLRFRVGGVQTAFLRPDGLDLTGNGQFRTSATVHAVNTQPAAGMAGYFYNNSTWATSHFENDGTGEVLWLDNGGQGHFIVATDSTGWKFWVDQNGKTTTKVLEILGGSDLSEGFDVDDSRVAVEPGMVVSIDPHREGRLVPSSREYDRTVAGVVSGAGGIATGMVMGQRGSVADGEHPVALSGRVYCLADASSGPIEPGDLLTTSATPGHAMRAADPSRSQGAVLGKAMSRLDEGRGLVLALVGLQ